MLISAESMDLAKKLLNRFVRSEKNFLTLLWVLIFDKYDGLTLYKSDASQASNFDPNKADILIRFTMYGGSDETYSKKFHTTEKYFHENYSNAFDSADEKLPGVGWEWGIIMPGDKENEYITLNHFNVRGIGSQPTRRKRALV